jgi:hypothetical protein
VSTLDRPDEVALISQFTIVVHPTLPILPLSLAFSPFDLPEGLRAVILATALSASPANRSAKTFLWSQLKQIRLAHELLQAPKLSSIAAAVLELATSIDTRNDYMLLSQVRQVIWNARNQLAEASSSRQLRMPSYWDCT